MSVEHYALVANSHTGDWFYMCLDPIDHKLYKFGKLYRARQVLCSLMTGKETIDEHS